MKNIQSLPLPATEDIVASCQAIKHAAMYESIPHSKCYTYTNNFQQLWIILYTKINIFFQTKFIQIQTFLNKCKTNGMLYSLHEYKHLCMHIVGPHHKYELCMTRA